MAAVSLFAAEEKSALEKGREVFQSCASCHNILTDARKSGPSLRTLYGKVRLINGKRTTDENVTNLILEGYNGMPSYRYLLRPEDRASLIVYLKTLRARPEFGSVLKPVRGADADVLNAGEKGFAAHCGGCHERGVLPLAETPLIARARDGHAGSTAVTDDGELFRLAAYLKARP